MVILHWKWIPVIVIVLFVPVIENIKTVLHNEILNTEHKSCSKIIFFLMFVDLCVIV